MIQLQHNELRGEPLRWVDQSVVPVSRVWGVALGTRWFGVGGRYVRPIRLEVGSDDASIRIHDHTMIVRLAATLALIVAAMIRKART